MGKYMSRELTFLMVGIILGILPSLMYVAYKKLKLFEIKPDQIITYAEIGDTKLSLHIFSPQNKTNASENATLLFFHGGAWQLGNPTAFYQHCDYFSSLGLTCISVQYRIAAIHNTDPRAAVEDSRRALDYLHQHAEKLQIDPSKTIVAGGSSGGHLAATLGIPVPLTYSGFNNQNFVRPSAMILYNPMVDLSPGKPDHHLVAEFWHEISPIHHIDANVPPTIILMGTKDPEISVATAKGFCKKISKKGGRCDLALYEGAKHGFFNHSVEKAKYFHLTNERVSQFLKELGYLEN